MQRSLFPRRIRATLGSYEHGGAVRRGRRKIARPMDTRKAMHVVLTSNRARGAWSLRRHERAVRDELGAAARRHGIKLYDFACLSHHLHLLLRARRRDEFQAFLRSFAGL